MGVLNGGYQDRVTVSCALLFCHACGASVFVSANEVRNVFSALHLVAMLLDQYARHHEPKAVTTLEFWQLADAWHSVRAWALREPGSAIDAACIGWSTREDGDS